MDIRCLEILARQDAGHRLVNHICHELDLVGGRRTDAGELDPLKIRDLLGNDAGKNDDHL